MAVAALGTILRNRSRMKGLGFGHVKTRPLSADGPLRGISWPDVRGFCL